MGFEEADLGSDLHLPGCRISPVEATLETEEKQAAVRIEAKDSKYLLDRVTIYVNGVPVHGTRGYSLRDKRAASYSATFRIPLCYGRNRIELTAHNRQGAESLRDGFDITCTAPPTKPSLFLLSVGVSKYSDANFNLDYAAKDANDVVTLLSNQTQRFAKIRFMRLLDKKATRGNMLQAKNFLATSTVDDYVVVFLAGHGLLDSDFDYYFATWDTDFADPSSRSLSYDAVAGLVDGIPARNKLMLIDTCYSGELDREQAALLATSTGTEVASRGGRGLQVQPRKPVGLKNRLDLEQTLFADLRRGSGAFVISAAHGGELARENRELSNGVFTFAVIEGIKTRKADSDGDTKITVEELRNYVTERVRGFTSAQQTPTPRRENIEFDFVVY
jgi:hypothetical protein